jgi:hypothetical protein
MSKEEAAWSDLIIDVFNRLAKEHASVTYSFNDVDIQIPSALGKTNAVSHIKINGSITIETKIR